ncbi:MAG: putative DNA binding domain-containing protein [Candidatus Kapabacteria bacterium]|nr:putative DNA binding domain-containing protein [Candidatus Kapabacteria bacterium]
MTNDELMRLILTLVKEKDENETLEFKENFHGEEELGKCISAIANSARLLDRDYGYIVFGIIDESKQIVGSEFNPDTKKVKKENLKHWLQQRLHPSINIADFECLLDNDKRVVLFKIPASNQYPVQFMKEAYVRLGSSNRKLNDFPEKLRAFFLKGAKQFEKAIAKENVTASEVIELLSTESYFNLMKIPYPTSQELVLEKLISEDLVIKSTPYSITNLGAILFAKNLKDFDLLYRKSLRIIVYKGKSKVSTERERTVEKGYAISLKDEIDWIKSQIPSNEEISKVIRNNVEMYPEIALRELIVNMLIHQDYNEQGFPMVEIYSDRIEISNPGKPLIQPDRFIDEYKSRNDNLADKMRRMGFCEEKGSGLDKVINYIELFQLPPMSILIDEVRTKMTLYSYKKLNELDKKEKILACYQHACLKFVSAERMTNASLRDRFKIENRNYAIASRIIKDAIDEGKIKNEDPNNSSRKHAKYIPYWA